MPSYESDMPSDTKSPFSFTNKDMEDILFGVGQGMSTSESGFVRGFGTAMAAAAGQKIRKRDKEEARAEREKEIADLEARQISSEIRAEGRQIAAEERAASARAQNLSDVMKAKKQERADIRAEEEEDRLRYIGQGVNTIGGKYSPGRVSPEFKFSMSKALGSEGLSIGGKPPSGWSDDDLFSEIAAGMDSGSAEIPSGKRKRRVMARDPDTGQNFFAIEDVDQETPLFGDRGRNYAD
jgi:hypothetical protein